jgi:hypothetical protein
MGPQPFAEQQWVDRISQQAEAENQVAMSTPLGFGAFWETRA